MKRFSMTAVAAVLIGAPCSAADAFDFDAISRARFEREDPSAPELVKDPFAFTPVPHTCWNAASKKDEPLAVDGGKPSVVNGPEDDSYRIFVPDAVADRVGGKEMVRLMHTTAVRTLPLPDTAGGRYRLRLKYRANHTIGNPDYNCYVVLGVGTNGFIYVNLADSGEDSDYWIPRERSFDVPPGTESIKIYLRFDGAGYLRIGRLGIRKEVVEDEPAVSFLVKPYGLLDGRFHVESGDVGALSVTWKRAKATKVQWWRDAFQITVPPGFRFIGLTGKDRKRNGGFRREKRADGSEQITAPMSERCQPLPGGYHHGFGFGVLLRAEASAGTTGRLAFRALLGGKPAGDEGGILLESVAPAAPVETPADFLAGAMLTYDFYLFRTGDADANEIYADFLVRRGVRWLMPQSAWLVENPALVPMWRRKGIRYVTPSDHARISNGYNIRGTCPRPEADRFVKRPGLKEHYDFRHSACPASIYEERPFFVTNVMPSIVSRNVGADGMWVNWEPYYFKGCHCAACLGRMKTWKGSPENFHSMQHGRMAVTVHRWMKKLFKPGTIGLAPAIGWPEVGSYGRTHGYPADKLAKDYIGEMEWLPAWGPYIGWSAEEGPYSGTKGKLVATFLAAKDVREEIDRLYPVGKRPKLMGQSAGTNWAIQPDWLEISMSACFFNRWEAVAPWVFPFGSDARHWAAYGRAVTRAAKYERAVRDGTRRDAATTLAAVGKKAVCAWPDKMFLPDARDVPLLQQTTWDFGGVRYVTVFNFDDTAPAAFVLRTSGLDGVFDLVGEDGRTLPGGAGATGAALASAGRKLSLPAATCRTVEIRPKE